MNNPSNQSEVIIKTRHEGANILVSQLKTKIFELEQNEKSYESLQLKFKNIQLENNTLTERIIELEYQLRQKTENLSKVISELQSENKNLQEELNNKITTNKSLFNNLIALNQTIDDKNKHIEEITQAHTNKEASYSQLENTLYTLKQEKKTLNDQILFLKNENNTTINRLEEKESLLQSTQEEKINSDKKKNEMNMTIMKLQEELTVLNDSLTKEKRIKNECKKTIEDIQVELDQKTNEINKLNNERDSLRLNYQQTCIDREKLMNEIEIYKNHIMVLTKANKELMDELDDIIITDGQLNQFLLRDEQLLSVINDLNLNHVENITIDKEYSHIPIDQSNKSFGHYE